MVNWFYISGIVVSLHWIYLKILCWKQQQKLRKFESLYYAALSYKISMRKAEHSPLQTQCLNELEKTVFNLRTEKEYR
jgi:hypothetical protein